MVLADYTFGQALLTVLEIFVFAAWLMVLFTIIGDLFRDHEMSGWGKAAWIIFLIFIPFLGTLIYLIVRGSRHAGPGAGAAAGGAEAARRLRQADRRRRIRGG